MASGNKSERRTARRAGEKGLTGRKWKKQTAKGKDEGARHFMKRWRQRVNRAGSTIKPHVALRAINSDIQSGKAKFTAFVWSESTTLTHWQIEAAGKFWHVVYNRKIGSVVTVFLDPLANGGELKRLNKRNETE